MTQWWGTRRGHGGELYTYHGHVLIHDNPDEIEWLLVAVQTVPLIGKTPDEVAARLGQPVRLWRDHPGMAAVQWPLRKEAFI
jgi:hypothetical protein